MKRVYLSLNQGMTDIEKELKTAIEKDPIT